MESCGNETAAQSAGEVDERYMVGAASCCLDLLRVSREVTAMTIDCRCCEGTGWHKTRDPYPRQYSCWACEGEGKVEACASCGGRGDIETIDGREIECPTCKGSGQETLPDCRT